MLNSVPAEIRENISSLLQCEFKLFSFCGGGCISHSGKLTTQRGDFFLKWNDAKKFPGMFEAEARGLKLLKTPEVIDVPEVVAFGEAGRWQFILMEFIEENSPTQTYWKDLGQQLASLHRCTSHAFGLDHDNYIGSLRQFNMPEDDWINFFIHRRLDFQLKLALSREKIDKTVARQFETLYKKLPDLLPKEKPSLLHGDLWSGNLIANENGYPCLIDPAAYYGHREADIAFTKLFGGFSSQFYDSYQNFFPLQPGFKQRSEVYNLYPLLVHVNLFGGGYLSRVVSILGHLV